ncbi:transcription termination/antitermination NusG family protein [Sansalvadorimonas verongulae]|uniref:transcription termination/antitermination NusG family protein n=1 Tax=Sansalvadorimonas verongulae TaxID=2172824 RepID=UPI0012BCA298|nr:transcription termination/antitermination NusG family protein [Sansalvadorimonas verongulae]MTI14052.1 transcription/translation regulatory transformer protein RfaH [Sansalvadorimonas verongulae]
MEEWFVVKTKPRQEQRAVENLENQGFAAYCPVMLHKRKQPGRRESCKLGALFPGYIFLLDESHVGGVRWDKVRSTRGVTGFIRFGTMYARVSDELVEGFRDNEKVGSVEELFKAGQPVVFTEGAYKNLPAVYLSSRGEDRCMVLLSILNSQREVEARLLDITA